MQSTASTALVRRQDYTLALSSPKCSDPGAVDDHRTRSHGALGIGFAVHLLNPLLGFVVSELRHELRESQQESYQQSKS